MESSGVRFDRILLMFGLPIAAGVATGYLTHSILFGILAGVGAFIVVLAVALKLTPTPAHMKPGTRAWEAKLTADLLIRTIDQRLAQKRQTTDASKVAQLDREIAFLSAQVDENTAIWQANDPSPGKGYVGFTPYNGP